MVAESPAYAGHQQVSFHQDRSTGLRAIVSIHHSRFGRACGGIRWRPYADDAAALLDVLRLSEAMTYKAVLAGLPVGGGKSVIIGDPASSDRDSVMHAMGDIVESYAGAYVCAPDMGVGTDELQRLSERTEHVVGFRQEAAPYTARGALRSVEAVATWMFQQDTVSGLRINIQGVGNVGAELARMLAASGAEVAVSDADPQRTAELAEEIGARVVPVGDIVAEPGDIFIPAAMGGTINRSSIPELDVKAVVGPANNQLAEASNADSLRARGIEFVPDFVASAGGVIAGVYELGTFDQATVHEHIDRIAHTTLHVLEQARVRDLNTTETALAVARERLDQEKQENPA